MAGYQLTRAADSDLDEIYACSFERYGEAQAAAYLDSIDSRLAQLANHPRLGRKIRFDFGSYYRFIHQEHSIYYRQAQSGILVIRILDPGRSPERQLHYLNRLAQPGLLQRGLGRLLPYGAGARGLDASRADL